MIMVTNYFKPKNSIKKFLREIYTLSIGILNIKIRYKISNEWGRKVSEENKNKEIVLIAGGPSYNDELAEFLLKNRDDYVLMVVNYYVLNKFSEKIIPDYYVLSDPLTLISVPSENNSKLYKYIKDNKIKIICPIKGGWEVIENAYLRFDDRECLLFGSVKPDLPRGYTSNTFFKAIAMATALKFRKIYLFGFDYDYFSKISLDENNRIKFKSQHHYGVEYEDLSFQYESIGHLLNHLSRDHYYISNLKNDRIINVTEKSMIDCFERMSPEYFMEKNCR